MTCPNVVRHYAPSVRPLHRHAAAGPRRDSRSVAGVTTASVALALSLGTSPASAAVLLDDDGATLEVYGNLQFALSSLRLPDADGDVDPVDELADNGSTLGLRGTRALGDGLDGYFRYEFEGDADEIRNGAGIDTGDQAYVGLQGAFGDVRLGSWDPLIDDLVQDPLSSNDFFDLSDSNGSVEGDDGVATQADTDSDREGDKIQYTFPPLAGVTVVLGMQVKGDGEAENVSGSTGAAPFAGVAYETGPFRVAAVWDSLDNLDGDVSGRVTLDANGDVVGEFDAGDQFGLVGEFELDALRVAIKYERYASGDEAFVADEDRAGIGARYGYGRGDVYAAYQYVDVGDAGEGGGTGVDGDAPVLSLQEGDEYNELVGGATFEIADGAYVFAEGALYDREDDVGNGVAVGAAYAF